MPRKKFRFLLKMGMHVNLCHEFLSWGNGTQCLFTSDGALRTHQSNNYTKVQSVESMSLLGTLTGD